MASCVQNDHCSFMACRFAQMFTKNKATQISCSDLSAPGCHACPLRANYTSYDREQRCSLTSKHHRASSRKLKPSKPANSELRCGSARPATQLSKLCWSSKSHWFRLLCPYSSLRFMRIQKWHPSAVLRKAKQKQNQKNCDITSSLFIFVFTRWTRVHAEIRTHHRQVLWSD